MTAIIHITQGERAYWQRCAAAELAAILAAHPSLPCISWTVGPAGPVVVGQVSGPVPAGQVRQVFEAWRSAMALEEYREHQMSGGAAWLRAASRRHRVTIRLTATVCPDDDGQD